jgi:outer membrane biosynthesis protein TonB
MVTIKVLKPFFDMGRKCDRKPGDTFLATEARANQILSRLPGYVEWDGMPVDEEEQIIEDVVEEEPTVAPEPEPVEDVVEDKPTEVVEPEPEPVEDVVDEEPTVAPEPEPVADVVEYPEPLPEPEPAPEAGPDYSKMTNSQLKALCDERGITVPPRAKKAVLVALLEG